MYDIVGKNINSIPLVDIIPNEYNTRLNVDDENIKGLALSIKNNGFLQPLLLRKIGMKYEIILGYRRYIAAKFLNLRNVPAILIDEKGNINYLENSLLEKLLVQELSPIDEANTYRVLQQECHMENGDINSYTGKTDNYIINKLDLLNLTKECQTALEKKSISEGHAKVLLKVSDSDIQNRLLEKIMKDRLTVKDTDDYIISNKLNSSPNLIKNTGSYLGNLDVVNLNELDNEEMQLIKIPNKKEKIKEVNKMDMNTLNQASQNNMGMNNGLNGNQNNFFPSVEMPEVNNASIVSNDMNLNMNNQLNNPFVDNSQLNTLNTSPVAPDIMSNPSTNAFGQQMPGVTNDFRVETPVVPNENTISSINQPAYDANVPIQNNAINMDNALICMRGIVSILQNMGYNVSSRENDVPGKLEFVIEIQK